MFSKWVSNLVVGANDFYFDDPFVAILNASGDVYGGAYEIAFYYPPNNAYYNGLSGWINVNTTTPATERISTVDPSNCFIMANEDWYGSDSTSVYTYGNSPTVPGQNPGQGGTFSGTYWYGMDLIVDDIASPTIDPVGISDSITVSRGGLPATVHATGVATDPLSKTTTTVDAASVGTTVPASRTIERYFFRSRLYWGSYINTHVTGPTAYNDGKPCVAGAQFHVQWDVLLVGCRIYKPPFAAGTIPISVYKGDGSKLAGATVTWVADHGGWREYRFDTPCWLTNRDGVRTTPDNPYLATPTPGSSSQVVPVDTTVNVYQITWLSPTGDYVRSDWLYNVFPYVNGPFVLDFWNEGQSPATGGTIFYYSTVMTPPPAGNTQPHEYYIDPIVQWQDPTLPEAWNGQDSYFTEQWSNAPAGGSNHGFQISVFWADMPFIAGYAAHGVNTITAGGDDIDGPGYADLLIANNMDNIPQIGSPNPSYVSTSNVLARVLTDTNYAHLVVGYYVADEPDEVPDPSVPASSLNGNVNQYRSPGVIQSWINDARTRDPTRPQAIGFSHAISINGLFYSLPNADMIYDNNEWRKMARVADMGGGDWYGISGNYGVPNGLFAYAHFTQRCDEMYDGRVPLNIAVETCSVDGGNTWPTPAQFESAVWACIIAGAAAITLFDHYFPSSGSNMDCWMLQTSDPSMRNKVLAVSTYLQPLAAAIKCRDTGLVTGWTTSNLTAGPAGGTYGVPMHYTTRTDGTYKYLFAMGIRPGATTATFTMPTEASKTLTVLNESRTVATDSTGTFSDSFPADYTFHLYRWT
jgi:hypothetical protein